MTITLNSYSRAITRHSAALAEARMCRRLGLESAADTWMFIVRQYAAHARYLICRKDFNL